MKTSFTKRFIIMLFGNLIIGIAVGFIRIASLGMDPFSGANLAAARMFGLTFGTYQFLINIVLLVLLFLTYKKLIGFGTLVNMVGVGYGADLTVWLCMDVMGLEVNALPLRFLFYLMGALLATCGCALYTEADMGWSPYDAAGMMLGKATKGKLPYHIARVICDVAFVIAAFVLCLMQGISIWSYIGVGTIITALCFGPLIKFFRTHVAEKLIKKEVSES